ncbi:unnamed protein product, partial [Meganyctiphanes norvegica]
MASYPTFKASVATALNSWNALQFAVQQQAGGPQSKEIAQWMVGVTEQYFYDNGCEFVRNAPIHCHAPLLTRWLKHDINDQIIRTDQFMYPLFIHGVFAKDEGPIRGSRSAPLKSADSNFLIPQEIMRHHAEDSECPNLVSQQLTNLRLSEENGTSPAVPEPPRELTEEEEHQLQDEAEGWTVMKKGNKR